MPIARLLSCINSVLFVTFGASTELVFRLVFFSFVVCQQAHTVNFRRENLSPAWQKFFFVLVLTVPDGRPSL